MDRCVRCDRDGCIEACAMCNCPEPDGYHCPECWDGGPLCEHEQPRNAAYKDCFAHTINWRERALAAESDLTALRERMRWRDVTVELPDDHEDVPVVARDSTGKLYPTFAYKLTGVDGDVRWFNNGYQLDNVTRWQPLPAAPEVQNG